MPPLLRLLFGPPDSPIGRRTYLTLGASLMVFKYIVDTVVIALAAGVFWTPVDYLLPLITFKAAKVAQFPQGLGICLLLWTLPFIWIGVVHWNVLADAILHAIHRRVLEHVKAEAEKKG